MEALMSDPRPPIVGVAVDVREAVSHFAPGRSAQ
jgi:hypothetical protein